MAQQRVNPTRMELTRLKKRLKTAMRGHKLLKDKLDELMKQFLDIVRQNKEMREVVERGLAEANASFLMARTLMSDASMEEALMFPKQTVSLSVGTKNIMSVHVPDFAFETANSDASNNYAYGFANTSGELDDAIGKLSSTLSDMLALAQLEKTAQLLSVEIEKTRRRVNALEYVMIPNLTANIKTITMKLDENERGNLTRLMKVKDMMLKASIEARQRGESGF